jgi:hypothetical protein
MNVERDFDFDQLSRLWLQEGPTELSDRVLDAALADIHGHRQRRTVLGVPWRFHPMSNVIRAVAVAAVIAAVGIAGIAFLVRPTAGPATSPAPTPAATAGPTPSTGPSQSPTALPSASPAAIPLTTFTSSLLGYSVGLPGGWTQADMPDSLAETLYPGPDANQAERFVSPIQSPWLVVSSPTLGVLTPAEWLARSKEPGSDNGCRVLGSEPRTVAGIDTEQDILACSNEIVLLATVVHDDRIYQIAYGYLAGNDAASREQFRQVLASFAFSN